ncbi:MAG: phosphate/phosphite/phosphonate ABC transporter substrate-binding protein [Candidatus Electrothrix sp. AU1_5]|nr:phosphate/phosphite/phosphonate ABC transporter substrate-binding protein [Candidatus Electrothrix gigas]
MQKMNTRMNTHQISHQIFFFLAFLACLSVLVMTPYSAYSERNKAKLRIGIGPYYSTEQLRKDAHPLVVYLSKKLDRDVQLTITTSYKALAQEVKRGNIDIGFFNSALYVQLKQEYPQLKYLVTSLITQGGKKTPEYFSWIIAKKDSGITKVKHLRGKSFAFTNTSSSSGYIYPQAYFNLHGLVPKKFFSQIVFAGTHQKLTKMIAQGRVEAGASRDMNLWNAEKKYGRIFRRIKKIGPILNPSFAANDQVDDALCKQFIFALEHIPSGVMQKFVYTGFRRIPETKFNAVAKLLNAMH